MAKMCETALYKLKFSFSQVHIHEDSQIYAVGNVFWCYTEDDWLFKHEEEQHRSF